MKPLRILLLSAYDASSHRYWRELLTDHLDEFDWTVVTLPDRHFYWRVRSNALTYATEHRETLLAGYDLILATSMVDLCGLRGLLPQLSNIPTLLYFHENQFAYPVRKPGSNIINAQLVSIYSALSADRVLFNSSYNRQSFFSGATQLFEKMPDGVSRNLMAATECRSDVLAVPVQPVLPVNAADAASVVAPDIAPDVALIAACEPGLQYPRADRPLEIVWNHRWEYDKQPEVFFAALEKLERHGVEFLLHVMGQSFRDIPACFMLARDTFAQRIVTWGYQPRESYLQILRQSDIVVSSAMHDFQGLGMLEAISLGCVPVAPARVAYVEYVPEPLLYHWDPDSDPHINANSDAENSSAINSGDSDEAQALFEKLVSLTNSPWPDVPDVSRYLLDNLLGQYRQVLTDVAQAKPKG